MKNKWNTILKRIAALGIAVTMTGSVLTGCGDSKNEESTKSQVSDDASVDEAADTSEEVELVMYVISDRPAGQDIADENLNKLLKEKLNCTLKINWIAWSDCLNKYPLLFSSGEEFDMAYSATWLNYSSLAQKGAFMQLDDLWEKYAPDNYANATEDMIEQSKVNGHIYCIPTQLATYNAYGPVYRLDLVEDGSWDGVMETWEDAEEYLEAVLEAHPEMEGVDLLSSNPMLSEIYMFSKGYVSITGSTGGFYFYDPTEENPQVLAYYELPEVQEFLEMMERWNEKGFFPKSVLSDTDSVKFQNGKAAIKYHNLDTFSSIATIRPDYELAYTNIVEHVAHLPFTQDCMVIPTTAKNPERALMLWNLITTDQEVFDAFMYGIEGTTYELNEEGQYSILDPENYAASAMWAARTTELNRDVAGTPAEYTEWKEIFEDNILEDNSAERWASFVLDTSGVETEYAACQSVWQQYWWPLELAYTDIEAGLDEYKEKMIAAGDEKVKEYFQQQIDAYAEALKENK